MKKLLVVMLLTAIGVGCGAARSESTESPASEGVVAPTTLSNLGGDSLPVQRRGETYGHSLNRLTGSMSLQANGCWTVDLGDGPRVLVFPVGFTKPQDDGSVMEGPDRMRFSSGTQFDAIGGVVAANTFPGVTEGFWGGYLDFCEQDRPEVVVLESLAPAFRPDTLDEQQLADLLASAELTVSWECGLGFTLGSPDQTVALSIHPWTEEAIALPIALPSPDWEAVAIVGKNLMANNCDDVAEGWEPIAEVVARWPVAAGTVEFDVPDDIQCSGAVVEAALRDILISTPQGDVRLGDLDVVNTAYGCFAG